MNIDPPLLTEIIVDDEITLRPMFEVPAETTHALIQANLDHLGGFMAWATPDYDVDGVRAFQQARRETWPGASGDHGYAIFFDGELAGAIGIRGFDSPVQAVSLGYWISADMQGRGIVTRCSQSLINLAFETYNMNQVIIRAAPSNLRSRAIPERLGFTRTGLERQMSRNVRGELLDLVTYSLVRSEWDPGADAPKHTR